MQDGEIRCVLSAVSIFLIRRRSFWRMGIIGCPGCYVVCMVFRRRIMIPGWSFAGWIRRFSGIGIVMRISRSIFLSSLRRLICLAQRRRIFLLLGCGNMRLVNRMFRRFLLFVCSLGIMIWGAVRCLMMWWRSLIVRSFRLLIRWSCGIVMVIGSLAVVGLMRFLCPAVSWERVIRSSCM